MSTRTRARTHTESFRVGLKGEEKGLWGLPDEKKEERERLQTPIPSPLHCGGGIGLIPELSTYWFPVTH